MHQPSFTPARLTLARERNGLTKQQLATLCDVTRRTVTAWESGNVENPPVDQIARVLGFPSDFFYADEPSIVDKEAVSFRALSAMTARQTSRVLAASVLAVELSNWIDARYTTPRVDLPDLTENQSNAVPTEPGEENEETPREDPALLPAVAAESLRTVWKIPDRPISNVLSLLEARGFRVFSLPVGDREVDAFSFWRKDEPYIFLNTGKSGERMRFDLVHELGHLLMHRGVNTQLSRAYEQQAHDFAASFLMPADALYEQVIGRLRLDDVFQLKKYWKVSAVAMVYRLWELSIISDWHYRTWMIELSQRGYRSSEPDGMHPETSKLYNQLFKIAREDGYHSRRIAAELRIPENELDSMVFGLAMTIAPHTHQVMPGKSLSLV